MLLDELRASGVRCDPLTQLVVTCEVCRRPSNKECWTCGMRICDFCTLKRHWKAPPCAAPDRAALCLPTQSVARPRRACSSANQAQTAQHVPKVLCRKQTCFCVLQQSCCRRRCAHETLTPSSCWLRSGRAQGGFALHWPLINSDHMRTRLAQRELEAKRLEDARRWRPSPCCSGSWVRDDGPYSVRT